MIKYLSLFSGIGAFEKAFVNQEIPFELVGFSEIDKYASKSYSEIHGVPETMNFGDITKIDETKLPEIDFITYGFPCQDISLAGKQKGLLNEDGTKTRSGLFFDALRIIEHTQPKVAIAENVKNLTSKKFVEQFQLVLESLKDVGYNNYWKVLNAKDYGIPQNRERVFIVSIRKDVDNGRFQFPESYELKLRLKDMLDDEVDEKFYIDDKKTKNLIKRLRTATSGMVKNVGNVNPSGKGMNGTVVDAEGIARTITIEKDEGQKILVKTDTIRQVCNIKPTATRTNPNQGRVYDPEYIAPSLNTCGGGNLEPHVIIGGMQKNQAIKTDGICTTLTSSMGTGGGYIPMVTEFDMVKPKRLFGIYDTDKSKHQAGSVWDKNELAPTLTTSCEEKIITVGGNIDNNLRIRKLTPKECFRLMGFDDEDFEKCSCSNTQLYKQAGNSIVVDVAEEILCMLFDENGNFFI